MLYFLSCFGSHAALSQPCRSADCVQIFPRDAGVLNVRDYAAKGDGRTDDTAALLAAIAAGGGDTGREIWHDRIIYLPDGVYLVSDTLVKRYAGGAFASGMILIGQSVDHTILRLVDHAPGFADPAHPRPVVMATSKRLDTAGNRDYAGRGEGNDAYENFVENLTVDVGEGNPGAVGIDYLANNIGALRDVAVRAPAGSGLTGIAMLRKWPGPALLQRIAVQGFAVGIDVANSEYGVTLTQVNLTGQREAGLRNDGNALATEALTVAGGAGPAVINRGDGGLIVLTDASLASGQEIPFVNRGILLFRNLRSPGRSDDVWLSGMTERHPTPSAWSLPHPQAPRIPADRLPHWAGVSAPAQDREDATARLQTALRSGAATLYLQHGTYWISAPLQVPSGVRRILGMNATLKVLPQRRPDFARTVGMLVVDEAGSDLAIERLAFDNTDAGPQVAVQVGADRTVLLKDIVGAGVTTLDRLSGGGAVFVEDSCCGLLHVAGKQPVIARQLNSEGGGVRVVNDGAKLTIIGLKTEGFCTAVQTGAGGRTEVLGGLLYVVGQTGGADIPAFITSGGQLSASFVEESLVAGSQYRTYLADLPAHRQVSSVEMPARGLGHSVPLLH